MLRDLRAPALAFLALCYVVVIAACGPGDASVQGGVTIEPLMTSTPRMLPPIGGKPATPPLPQATATREKVTEADPTPPPEVPTAQADAPASEPAAPPTATQTPLALDGSTTPTEGRWIDVNVTTYAVRLMDGTTAVQEIAPVGVGLQVDTGEYASTQTGLFYVHTKIEELAYDPPYDTYISHWVGFDSEKANGFHSFLKDAAGTVVDPSTGRVSNGCIRTGSPEVIYTYAELGMPVWVHW